MRGLTLLAISLTSLLGSPDPEALNNLARLQPSDAAACGLLLQAVAAAPSHAGSYNNMANLDCVGLSNIDMASIATRLQPQNPLYRFTYGTVLHRASKLSLVGCVYLL